MWRHGAFRPTVCYALYTGRFKSDGIQEVVNWVQRIAIRASLDPDCG